MRNPKRLCLALSLAFVVMCPVLLSAAMNIGQNLLWFGRGDGGDPFRPGVDFATTNDPWKPEVIEDLKPFTVLRMLDWSMATFINMDSQWMQRRQKTSSDQDCSWSPGDNGIAYEWQIDICNKTNTHLWAFVPCKAVTAADKNRLPDYALRLALLIKTGVDTKTISLDGFMSRLESVTADDLIKAGGTKTIDPLKSNLQVYVEYDDEVNWDRFAEYVAAEGAKLGTGADQFYVFASCKLIAAFNKVFGKTNKRFYRLMSGQWGNFSRMVTHVKGLEDFKINIDSVKLDGYTIAPYFGSGDWAALKANIDKFGVLDSNSDIGRHKRMCNKLGIELCAYEIGQHIWNPPNAAMQSDPQMYGLYMTYMDNISKWINGVACHYGYAGAATWGSKASISDAPSQAPKYRALVDWAKAHPVSVRQQNLPEPSFKVAPAGKQTTKPGCSLFGLPPLNALFLNGRESVPSAGSRSLPPGIVLVR